LTNLTVIVGDLAPKTAGRHRSCH